MEEKCICCGETIPEGKQVCDKCFAPYKDDVAVVRCKDCRYFRRPDYDYDYCYCTNPQWEDVDDQAAKVTPNSYCSWGSRR